MEMVKQERELQTPYLHSQDSWDHFWETRRGQLSIKDRKVFTENSAFIIDVLRKHFNEWYRGSFTFMGKTSLEIGCGRGIISSCLKDYGFQTFGIDILDNATDSWSLGGRLVLGDVKCLPYKSETFDVIITYGLLEHFSLCEQVVIIAKSMQLLKYGGIAIHYIVPKKLTNYFEDRNVYRDNCKYLNFYCPDWVYPIVGKKWKTNKWLGKGFFITQRR